jgi:hypothetical protein
MSNTTGISLRASATTKQQQVAQYALQVQRASTQHVSPSPHLPEVALPVVELLAAAGVVAASEVGKNRGGLCHGKYYRSTRTT